jgi:integrase
MTFEEFWVMWFDEYVVPNNSHSEQQTKRSVFNNHLQSVFGGVPLAEIDRTMIERFKGSLLKKGLKKKTINSILSHLRCCLGEAEERELIERVPRIRAMKTQDPEWTYLTSEELNRLLVASDEVERGEMVRLAARTGMRLGELLGLRWKDVDFDARVVRIANTVVRGKETLSAVKRRARRARVHGTCPLPRTLLSVFEPFRSPRSTCSPTARGPLSPPGKRTLS